MTAPSQPAAEAGGVVGHTAVLERLIREFGQFAGKEEIAAMQAGLAALRKPCDAALLKALEAAADGLDVVADLTWDKRHPDACRRACDEASDAASTYCEEARAALARATEPQP